MPFTLPRPHLQRLPLQFNLLHQLMLGETLTLPLRFSPLILEKGLCHLLNQCTTKLGDRVVNTKYYRNTFSVFGHSEDRCFILHGYPKNYKAPKGSQSTTVVSAPTLRPLLLKLPLRPRPLHTVLAPVRPGLPRARMR